MNTKQVADELATTPRVLRIFIRQDPTYTNAGTGGHYEFTKQDLPTLRKRFDAWQSEKDSAPKAAPKKKKSAAIKIKKERYRANHDTPMDPEILTRRLTSAERKYRDNMSNFRVDRLEQRLRDTGKHISQMRDRDGWKKAV